MHTAARSVTLLGLWTFAACTPKPHADAEIDQPPEWAMAMNFDSIAVSALEAQVVWPDCSMLKGYKDATPPIEHCGDPVTSYIRYYAPRDDGVIVGSYLKPDLDQAFLDPELSASLLPYPLLSTRRRLVGIDNVFVLERLDQLPLALHAGCDNLLVSYDPKSGLLQPDDSGSPEYKGANIGCT